MPSPKNNLIDIPGTQKPAAKNPAKKKRTHAENKKIYAEVKATDQKVVVSPKDNTVQGEVINGAGRPSDYTPELAARICTGIAEGKSLRTVCKDEQMPAASTVFLWLQKHKEFSEQYTRATQERSEAMLEDMLDIADDGSNDWMERHYGDNVVWVENGEAINRSKLRVEVRKWQMSKMMPKKYGDKIDITSEGEKLPAPLFGGLSIISDNDNSQKVLE